MTLTNPLASSRYTQAMNSALAQGHGYDEASQLAANNFYSTLPATESATGHQDCNRLSADCRIGYRSGFRFHPFP